MQDLSQLINCTGKNDHEPLCRLNIYKKMDFGLFEMNRAERWTRGEITIAQIPWHILSHTALRGNDV